MLYRKISRLIESHLRSRDKRILIIDGARQVGKPSSSELQGRKSLKIS